MTKSRRVAQPSPAMYDDSQSRMMSGGDASQSWQHSADHEERKERHQCTDPICCIMFLASTVFWGFCLSYGIANGNAEKMYHGIQQNLDGTSSICGVSAGLEAKPLLYWCLKGAFGSGATTGNLDAALGPVCVANCPSEAGVVDTLGLAVTNAVPQECIDMGYATAGQTAGYQTIDFMNKYCLPNITASPDMNSTLGNIVDGQALSSAEDAMESLTSIQNAWPILVACFFVSVILGYLYLFLLKIFAKPLIFGTMIITIVGFGGLGLYLILHSDSIQESAQGATNVPDVMSDNTETTSKVLGGIFLVLSAGLIVLSLCLCSSIRTAAAVVEVTCVVIWEMWLMLFLPLFKALIKGGIYLICMWGLILLWTTADPETSGGDGVSRSFTHNNTETIFIWYFIFGSLWILAYLDAFYQFVVACMVADYYYEPFDPAGVKETYQCHWLMGGLRHGLWEHAGSLAFGSLLIAILQFIQKVLQYAEKQNQAGGGNMVITCILACLICMFKCCEEVVKFVNKNAYIDIAIAGQDGFCQAFKNAMKVMIESGPAMLVLNGATFVFSMFGVLFITLGSLCVAYIMSNQDEYNDFVNNGGEDAISDKVAVLVVAGVISAAVALCFMHVFDMASDTLIFCVGYDKMMHREPLTAPAELRVLFDEKESEVGRAQQGKGQNYS